MLKSLNSKKGNTKIPHPSLFEEALDDIKPPSNLVFRNEFSPATTNAPTPARNDDDILTPADRAYLAHEKTTVTDILSKYDGHIPLVPALKHYSPERHRVVGSQPSQELPAESQNIEFNAKETNGSSISCLI